MILNSIDSADFWLKVKEEAERSNKSGLDYICHISKTFADLYKLDKEPFKALALEFLTVNNIDDFDVPNDDSSYGIIAPVQVEGDIEAGFIIGSWTWKRHYKLRPLFIDYCINKFS